MGFSKITDKFRSWFLWGNIIAVIAVVIVLLTAAWIGLDVYTRHGEAITVPEVRHKSMTEVRRLLEEKGLVVAVTDTGYVKTLPADYVLEQNPESGELVKRGHTVSLTVNASRTPTITLPDIVQNSSLREATAKLKAMGFRVGMPHYVEGEKDWIYGATVNGRAVSGGDRIPVDATVVLQVGNGLTEAEDSAYYINHNTDDGDGFSDVSSDMDDFVEIP